MHLQDQIVRALCDDINRWPLLTRAGANSSMAESTKVEWLVDRIERCKCCGTVKSLTTAEYNYMQIFRTKVGPKQTQIEALLEHLDAIETALRDGKRNLDLSGSYPHSSMGGALELLGRWPHKDDYLALKILRQPYLLAITYDPWGVPLDTYRYEWISEVSLIARKGSD